MVRSEHLLVRADRLMSRGDNRPTPLFYASVVSIVPFGLSWFFGTFFLPSIAIGAVRRGASVRTEPPDVRQAAGPKGFPRAE